jgi:hypothetical protein
MHVVEETLSRLNVKFCVYFVSVYKFEYVSELFSFTEISLEIQESSPIHSNLNTEISKIQTKHKILMCRTFIHHMYYLNKFPLYDQNIISIIIHHYSSANRFAFEINRNQPLFSLFSITFNIKSL